MYIHWEYKSIVRKDKSHLNQWTTTAIINLHFIKLCLESFWRKWQQSSDHNWKKADWNYHCSVAQLCPNLCPRGLQHARPGFPTVSPFAQILSQVRVLPSVSATSFKSLFQDSWHFSTWPELFSCYRLIFNMRNLHQNFPDLRFILFLPTLLRSDWQIKIIYS